MDCIVGIKGKIINNKQYTYTFFNILLRLKETKNLMLGCEVDLDDNFLRNYTSLETTTFSDDGSL